MSKVAFVTYRQHPRMTADDSTLYKPLADYGIRLSGAAWDDLTVRWMDFDAVVLRSTWDYHLRLPEFLQWIDSVEGAGVSVWNPPALVRWNAEKTYLREIAARDVAIVPTVWLAQGDAADLPALLAAQGWSEAVIKPSVSASAYKTWRVSAAQAAGHQGRLDSLLKQSGVLVQAFIPQIATHGEWSLVFFRQWNGTVTFSHGVCQQPEVGDMRVQVEYGGQIVSRQPPAALVTQAHRILDIVPYEWLYVRVDGLFVDEQFALMELEFIEPHLFLSEDREAPQRFAAAIRSVMI